MDQERTITVDFHCHSTASDGTMRPSQIADAARECGFAALALTDHDNCDGVGELLAGAAASGPALVPGVELSIEPGEGFDRFHLLGLGVDRENPRLRALLSRILEGRNARNERIILNFARIGIEIPPDEIARYAHGDVLARPHFARWLADHGYARNVMDGFDRYLLPDSPSKTRCYEDRWHPPQEETFAAIHDSGGVCVMAHPKYWRRTWKRTGPDFGDAEREIARLVECGLDGIEAVYQANSGAETVGFIRIARSTGSLVSAGSDFHGTNKPAIRLGMEVGESLVAPLLERLGIDFRPRCQKVV